MRYRWLCRPCETASKPLKTDELHLFLAGNILLNALI